MIVLYWQFDIEFGIIFPMESTTFETTLKTGVDRYCQLLLVNLGPLVGLVLTKPESKECLSVLQVSLLTLK
jgi:hypothetical protein